MEQENELYEKMKALYEGIKEENEQLKRKMEHDRKVFQRDFGLFFHFSSLLGYGNVPLGIISISKWRMRKRSVSERVCFRSCIISAWSVWNVIKP